MNKPSSFSSLAPAIKAALSQEAHAAEDLFHVLVTQDSSATRATTNDLLVRLERQGSIVRLPGVTPSSPPLFALATPPPSPAPSVPSVAPPPPTSPSQPSSLPPASSLPTLRKRLAPLTPVFPTSTAPSSSPASPLAPAATKSPPSPFPSQPLPPQATPTPEKNGLVNAFRACVIRALLEQGSAPFLVRDIAPRILPFCRNKSEQSITMCLVALREKGAVESVQAELLKKSWRVVNPTVLQKMIDAPPAEASSPPSPPPPSLPPKNEILGVLCEIRDAINKLLLLREEQEQRISLSPYAPLSPLVPFGPNPWASSTRPSLVEDISNGAI